jgi:hypothetical protein
LMQRLVANCIALPRGVAGARFALPWGHKRVAMAIPVSIVRGAPAARLTRSSAPLDTADASGSLDAHRHGRKFTR